MERVGRRVMRHARAVVILVVLITLLAAATIALRGLKTEFRQETFLPDTEIALASLEVSERFSASYAVPVVVHGVAGNALSRAALLEMLGVERALVEDPRISPWLENRALPQANVGSVANIVAQTVLAAQNVTLPTLDQEIGALTAMTDAEVEAAIAALFQSPMTPPEVRSAFALSVTKDFDPAAFPPSAKAALISLSLNASLVRGGVPLDALDRTALDVERHVDATVRAQPLVATRMVAVGENIIGAEINDANNASLNLLLPASFLAVLLILGAVYRSLFDLAISSLALLFSLAWMYGFAAAAGYVLNPLTLVVPILIVGLGIDYGIHIILRYREEAAKGEGPEDAAVHSVTTVGGALLLTTVTTVIAFLTNVISPLEMLAQFGILAAVGILATFTTMVSFVPAAKFLRERRRAARGKVGTPRVRGRRGVGRVLHTSATASSRAPLAILGIVLVLSVLAVYGAVQVDREFVFEDFLPTSIEITEEVSFVTQEFAIAGSGAGGSTMILVRGSVDDPGLLSALSETVDRMADDVHVLKVGGKPQSSHILSLMADYARFDATPGVFDTRFSPEFAAMYDPLFDSEGRPTPNATTGNVRALYGWLFANARRDVTAYLARDPSGRADATLLRVSTTATEEGDLKALEAELSEDKLPLDSAADSAVITGGLLLFERVTGTLEDTQISSLVLSIAAALILLVVVFAASHRAPLVGLLTAVPVLLVVAWGVGTMFLVGISFNVVTIVITSLIIGLGIDYAIHVSHRFMEDVRRYERVEDAVRSTLTHTGRALAGAAGTTVIGFGLLIFALLPPIQQFGAVTAMTILYSFLAGVFVLPALLVLWARRRVREE